MAFFSRFCVGIWIFVSILYAEPFSALDTRHTDNKTLPMFAERKKNELGMGFQPQMEWDWGVFQKEKENSGRLLNSKCAPNYANSLSILLKYPFYSSRATWQTVCVCAFSDCESEVRSSPNPIRHLVHRWYEFDRKKTFTLLLEWEKHSVEPVKCVEQIVFFFSSVFFSCHWFIKQNTLTRRTISAQFETLLPPLERTFCSSSFVYPFISLVHIKSVQNAYLL